MPQPAPIVAAAPSRWHALIVMPRKERVARAWLAERGVESFFPVRVNQYRQGGVVRRVEAPFIPGYLFTRFDGEPLWHAILARSERSLASQIRDVIRMRDGQPGILTEASLARLYAMASREEEITRAHRQARAIRARDRVRPVSPLIPAGEYEVVEIVGQRCRIEIEIFGAMRAIEVDVKAVEKVAGARAGRIVVVPA
jgi:transcription antitermination factor NusG